MGVSCLFLTVGFEHCTNLEKAGHKNVSSDIATYIFPFYFFPPHLPMAKQILNSDGSWGKPGKSSIPVFLGKLVRLYPVWLWHVWWVQSMSSARKWRLATKSDLALFHVLLCRTCLTEKHCCKTMILEQSVWTTESSTDASSQRNAVRQSKAFWQS